MVQKDMQLVFSAMLTGLVILAYAPSPSGSSTVPAMKPNRQSSPISGQSVSVPLLQEGAVQRAGGKRNTMKKKLSPASFNSKKLLRDFNCNTKIDCVRYPETCPENLCYCDIVSFECGPLSNVCLYIEDECPEDNICPEVCKCDYDKQCKPR